MTEDRTLAQTPATRARAILPLALLAAASVMILHWWTASWMIVRWRQPGGEYGHGWMILLCSLFFVFLKRKQIAACPLRPRAWGLALLLPALAIHLVATAWRVGFVAGFALLPMLAGMIVALAGTRMLRIVLFPLAFLAFMIPLPEMAIIRLSFNLKLFAATIAANFVAAVGLAAVRSGSYILIPEGTILVDDVCSGLKYLIALTAFGALCAHISRLNRPGKAILLLLSAPIALFANVVRLILMVLVAFAFGIEATEAWFFHDVFGLLLFAIAFAMLFGIEFLLLKIPGWDRRKRSPEEDTPPQEAKTAPRAAKRSRLDGAAPATAFTAMLLGVVGVLALTRPGVEVASADIAAGIPIKVGEWRGEDHAVDDRTYELLGTRDVIARMSENPSGERVQMLIVVANQTRRRTHPPEQCIRGEGYDILHSEDRRAEMPNEDGAAPMLVREMLLRRGGAEAVSWYFFKSGPHLNTSYWRHQAGVALRKLAEPDAMDVLVRLDTPSPPDEPDVARETLGQFLAEMMP